MGGVVDAVKDVVDDVVDFVYEGQKDILGGIQDIAEDVVDIVGEFAEETFEEFFDFLEAGNEWLFDTLNWATGDIGVFDFALDINKASHDMWTAVASGDLKALLTIAIIGSSLMIGAYNIAYSSIYTLNGAFNIASGLSTIYSTAASLVISGQMALSTYLTVLIKGNLIQDAMNLSFINSWVNGTMGRWMAGGELYDAPRAGDLLFNPTGTQNTTRFLGLQDTNSNFYVQTNILGYFHTPHKRKFGAKAGDEGFSVSSLVKG